MEYSTTATQYRMSLRTWLTPQTRPSCGKSVQNTRVWREKFIMIRILTGHELCLKSSMRFFILLFVCYQLMQHFFGKLLYPSNLLNVFYLYHRQTDYRFSHERLNHLMINTQRNNFTTVVFNL